MLVLGSIEADFSKYCSLQRVPRGSLVHRRAGLERGELARVVGGAPTRGSSAARGGRALGPGGRGTYVKIKSKIK